MVTFYITEEQRRRAQERAADLDIDKSDPPGRFPYVWDNRLSSVKRWYDYGSAEEKVGTVYFQSLFDEGGNLSGIVECTTEITQHRLEPERRLDVDVVSDPEQHQELGDLFLAKLVSRRTDGK